MTPKLIVAQLVTRLLDGEEMTRYSVATEFALSRSESQYIIKKVRNALYVEHGAILPIPRKVDEFVLKVSADRKEIFGGEMQPTLAIRATVNHYADRFDREAAHSKRPSVAGKMSGALEYQAKALSAMTEVIEEFIKEELA